MAIYTRLNRWRHRVKAHLFSDGLKALASRSPTAFHSIFIPWHTNNKVNITRKYSQNKLDIDLHGTVIYLCSWDVQEVLLKEWRDDESEPQAVVELQHRRGFAVDAAGFGVLQYNSIRINSTKKGL